jgi:tRNA (adenine57-N1/adenine58-N1)-methyltransferase
VRRYFGDDPPHWRLHVGDLAEHLRDDHEPGSVDRVVLDMLSPWELLPAVAEVMTPGGSLAVYVATTTQMSRVVESARESAAFTEPSALEVLQRTWHVEGLSVRPDHRMVGHTGFLVTMRRLAPGVSTPARRRRPAPGAYGDDWAGPDGADSQARPGGRRPGAG